MRKTFIILSLLFCSISMGQRLIPIEISTDDSYILELGDLYARFYRNGGIILDDFGGKYTILTIFAAEELNDIQFAQTDDETYFVDGNDIPQILTRTEHNDWTIADVNFTTGPFLPTNDDPDVNITPSGTTGSITLTATVGSKIFSAASGLSHVGSIWAINQVRGNSTVTGDFSANGTSIATPSFTGSWGFTTTGTWVGLVTLQRSTNNGISWRAALVPTADTNYDNPAEIEDNTAIYRVVMSNYVSGTVTYTFTITDQTNKGVVRITAVTDSNTATATVLTELVDTNSTTDWREGYWSDFRGWPKTVEFHQQRLVYGGSTSYPQTIWFGKADPDDYANFLEGTLDTSSFTIALTGQNPIRWLQSDDFLLIGTSGSCGKYGDSGKAVTPTSPNYREQTQHGSAPIRAVLGGDTVLYIERGTRKVREFTFDFQVDKYQSPELTILAPEITESGIKEIAFQLRPASMLWCVLNDGNMATLTYQKDQSVVAWTKQTTDGSFESIAIISGTTGTNEDQVWVSVKRTIDGNDLRYVEQFQPRDFGLDINDAWFVDSGLSYDGVADVNFGGLSHLEGETLSIYADTLIESPEVVVDSNITIDNAASRVLAGLAFTSKLETLPLVIDPQDRAKNKKIKFIDFDLFETGYMQYGNGANATLTNMNFKNSLDADPNATKQGLYTSVVAFKHVTWPSYGSRKKQTIYVESSQPMPLTIRAITTEYKIYGN